MMKKIKNNIHLFSLMSVIAAMLIVLPLSNLFIEIFSPVNATWVHIREYLLFDYIKNTVILIVFTGLLAGIIGFMSAYYVTYYDFKGRKMVEWLLILPLAVPSYIAAYIYADIVSYTGFVGRFFTTIGASPINIMSMPGAIIIFSFTLYPYVYMLVRSNLKKHSTVYIENAKLLKASKRRIITKIIIPLARPALIAGILLVVLETLNDYGLVKYFGVRVFSFAIFDAWFRLGDILSAIRLSGVVMILVFAIIFTEKLLRGKRKYNASFKPSQFKRKPLSKKMHISVLTVLITIVSIGFFIPVSVIIYNTINTFEFVFRVETVYLVINTITIAFIATTITVFIALMLANYGRTSKSRIKTALLKITNLGYAIPGAVIAVSVLLFFTKIDRTLLPIYKVFNADTKTLVLSSTLVMLVFAYVLRFMTIAFNSVEASYDKVGLRYTEASYLLGVSKIKTLFKVDIPLIKPGLITAFIIVFIDVVKELPLTLILRPTNYDTIATKVFTYANDEMIHEASGPALMLILISSVLIYYLTHQKRKRGD